MAATRDRYNAVLRALLASRRDELFEEEMSFMDESLVPLDLVPNSDFEQALSTAQHGDQWQHGRQEQHWEVVTLADIVERRRCGEGVSVIVGPPGAGKSTIMRQLAVRLAERGEHL